MTVSGWADIDGNIDYTLSTGLPKSGLGASVADNLLGELGQHGAKIDNIVKLDINVSGTYDNPKIKVKFKDLAGDIKDAVVETIQETIQDVKDTVRAVVNEKINEAADNVVKEAEKQAAKVRAGGRKLAEQTRKLGYDQAQKLVDDAKGPLAKALTKKGAEKLRKETDKKANKIITEADRKADGIVTTAKAKADKMRR